MTSSHGNIWTCELGERFARFAGNANESLLIVAPWVTLSALENICKFATAPTAVITTWETDDILTGFSDIRIYSWLMERGHELRLRPGLHAKLVVADSAKALVSTANITNRGLGLGPDSTLECAVPVSLSTCDLKWVRSIYESSIQVTGSLYQEVADYIDQSASSDEHFDPIGLPRCTTPQVFMDMLRFASFKRQTARDVSVSELLHDAKLLKMSVCDSREILARKFFELPRVREFERFCERGRYFGEIRRWLRSRVAGDIVSHRDITWAVQRLLSWTTSLSEGRFSLARPNYSQLLMATNSGNGGHYSRPTNSWTAYRFRPPQN